MKRFALTLGLMLALAAFALLDPFESQAVRVSTTNTNSIESVPVCAGPPTTNDLFSYNGTNFCGQQNAVTNSLSLLGGSANPATTGALRFPNNVGIVARNAANTTDLAMISMNASDRVLLGYQGSFPWIGPTGGIAFAPGGVTWGDGVSEAAAPRSVFGAFTPSVSVVVDGGYFQPTKASHITAHFASPRSDTVPAGCTTAAVLSIKVGGTEQAASRITFVNGTGTYATTGLSIAVTAGQAVRFTVVTATAGCTTVPINVSEALEYTTD